ncbi:class I SAM-dependent methyltransferase [Kitasatospora sp. HPMI-4]|uniref:class I SAM-dependent methyltransferase n=1 Tax=Kitasatospora sp. HPMI-4 TaxID=3448443 RepID=UPI003F1CD6BE
MTTHHTEDLDGDAHRTEPELEAELHSGCLAEASRWLRDLLGPEEWVTAAVRRVLDVGSGPGVASCELARAFPQADVVAVDRSHSLLARAGARAAERGLTGRLTTLRAEHPEEFGRLGPAEVIWTGNVCRHLGDQQAAVRSLASALRPGGLLAVCEHGLPLRFLPRDIGMGRPGLQARLDAALEERFAARRAGLSGTTSVVEDWPLLLAAAGLVPTGSRTFLIDLPAPLGLAARRYLHTRLTRLLAEIGDQLTHADRLTVEQLLDEEAGTGILWRSDAFYLTALTVHTARRCARA